MKNYHFYQKKKIEKVEKLDSILHRRQRKICHSLKNFKAGIKSWIKTKRGTQSN